MHLIDEMLLEVAEHLSDHEVHCIFAYLRRERLIKYYKLKNFYDYKDFFLYPPTRALLTRMKLSTGHRLSSRILKYFPKTIRKFKYYVGVDNLYENHIPIIPDDVKCDFELNCTNSNINLSQLPKNTIKLVIWCNNLNYGLALNCNLKCLKLSTDNVNIDLNNLPVTLERLELIDCDNFNQPILKLPNNLKYFHMGMCHEFTSKIILPPNLVEFGWYINDLNQCSKLPSGLIKLFLHDVNNLISENYLQHLTELKKLHIYTDNNVKLPNNLIKLECTSDFNNNILPTSLEKLIINNLGNNDIATGTDFTMLYNLQILRISSSKKIKMPPYLIELECNYEFYCKNKINPTIRKLHIACNSDMALNELPANVKRLTLSIDPLDYDVNKPKRTTIEHNRLFNIYMETYLKQDTVHYNSMELGEDVKDNFAEHDYPKITFTDDILNILKDVQFDIKFYLDW
jgi:hypothetical protein